MKHLCAAVALLAAFGQTLAGELTLYSRPDFHGSRATLQDDAPNFRDFGFNDRVSSLVVQSGAWELCEHKDFGGHCVVLERGEYANLERFNNAISSAREVRRWRGRERQGWREERRERGEEWHEERREERREQWREEHGRGAPVELFAGRRFEGDSVRIGDDVRTLRALDFNDRAGSVVIREGEWELCEHADYRGRCAVFGPGRYPFLEGLNNELSSLRRVR